MIRRLFPLLVLSLLSSGACDRTTSLAVTPEVQEETSFENGLDGWSIDQTTTSTGTATVTGGGASEGANYVRVTLAQGSDFVWLERSFTLEPSTAYSVTLSADLTTFAGSGDLRVFAGAVDPDGSGFGSEGPLPADWTRTLAPRPFTTDAQGRVWVALGVAATGQAGEFGIDQLGVAFLRTSD